MDFTNYNIILINIDGFRKDKIELCPTLNKCKNESMYFSNMNTVAPYTFASLHAIFSSLYPSKNGVNGYYNIFKFKKNEITTFVQLLQRSGYYTSCDIIDDSVVPASGFNERNVFDEKTVDFNKRHRELIEKLSHKKKFFLFLHYTETHKHLVDAVIQKYKQESNDDEYFESRKENDERYNSYLPLCDQYVKTIMNAVSDAQISDKTIMIFFADHGTSLGEKKGEKFYGVFVYDYTVNVFCIITIPKQKTQKIDKQCSTLDIFPTITEIAGLSKDNPTSIQGTSLFEFIKNPSSQDREIFVETGGLYGPWPSPDRHNVFCIKINDKKLIYNDYPETWEFYDLAADPNEENNLYDEKLESVQFMKNRLAYYLRENNVKTKLKY